MFSSFFPDFSDRRRRWRGILLAALCGFGALLTAPRPTFAAPAAKPVTVQDLSLLLHGGYTGDEVLRETAGRPLLVPLDDAAEKTLRDAGADARFIDALRTSRRPLTDAEADAARQQQAAVAARDAESRAAYLGRMVEANQQSFEAHQAARRQAAFDQMAGQFHGKLVSFRDGRLQPCGDDAVAGKKLFAFYFSALWCGPCRQFTPKLVKFYRDFAPKHPAFEVVFVSQDRSASAMQDYMRQDAMPWPALAYDRREQETGIMGLAKGGGIPRLVLVDGAGRVVSDSYVNGEYLGPQHVLDDLTKLAAAGN